MPLSHRLTVEGHDKHGDGNNPRHSAVCFPKLLYNVLKEDAKALDGTVREHLHKEEGHAHHPPPASIRGL